MVEQQSRLLSLPPELRNQIYEIIGAECLCIVALRYPKPLDVNTGAQALLLTCRQTYAEFKSVIRNSTPHILDVEYSTSLEHFKSPFDPATDLFPVGIKKIWLRMKFLEISYAAEQWRVDTVNAIWTSMLEAVAAAPDLEEVVIVRRDRGTPERPFAEAVSALKRAPRLKKFALQYGGCGGYIRSAEKRADGTWEFGTGWADEILTIDMWTED